MSAENSLFIINFKNYDNISGSRSLELAKIASKISRKYKIKIVVCPPQKAVSTEKPEVIIKSVRAVKDAKNSTRLLCGAGIISGNDVARALELGANGILVASGIVKAKNWERVIEEFSAAFVKKRKV